MGIAHGSTSIVILIKKSCSFLWNAKIPLYAPYKKDHLTRVVGGHKFCFSRRTGNRWLEFAFICDCATSEANADATERTSHFDTTSPVRVGICMCNISIKLGAIGKKDVLFVAVDGGYWTLREFHVWTCAPKVNSIDRRRESYIGTSVHVLSHGNGAHEGMSWTAIV